jgi:hypothetical protein
MELHQRERFFIEGNDCVNKVIPTRTRAEYNVSKSSHNIEYCANYKLNNIDKIKAGQAKYKKENADKIKIRRAEWRLNNREKMKLDNAKFYLQRKEFLANSKLNIPIIQTYVDLPTSNSYYGGVQC